VLRRSLIAAGRLEAFLKAIQPVSLLALLATLVLLFAFQGEQILAQPLVILLLAVPIAIQGYAIFGIGYLMNRVSGEQHCIAGPSALIGASNFFELAVATAISLFGLNSGAALATVVGVLIEVPVMLSLVKIVNGSKDWYENGIKLRSAGPAKNIED
jgi:ACR3 family arsenite transporter